LSESIVFKLKINLSQKGSEVEQSLKKNDEGFWMGTEGIVMNFERKWGQKLDKMSKTFFFSSSNRICESETGLKVIERSAKSFLMIFFEILFKNRAR